MLKRLTWGVLILFLIAFLNPASVLASNNIAVDRDGVVIINTGLGTAKNPDVIKAVRTKDLKQVSFISFKNQSTIAEEQPSGKYYRTVGYDMRLTDKDYKPYTDYIRFNYKPYRDEYISYMQNLIKNTPGLEFNKQYVSDEFLYREFFLKHFPAEILDKAKYLELKGIVEIYEVTGNSEKVLYTIDKTNWKNPYPYGFESYRSDIETRFVFVDLNPPEEGPDFYPTPEGANEYKNEFKTLAKTYTGNPGEIINIPVKLHNNGIEKGTTDFAATWYGTGWTNPIWQEQNIELGKGEVKEYSLQVKVPDYGEETRLVFRCNVDGKTPENEANKDNNIMIIKVEPPGIDVAAGRNYQNVLTQKTPGEKVDTLLIPTAMLVQPSIMEYNEPVRVRIRATKGFSYDKTVTLTREDYYYFDEDIRVYFTKPGTYTYEYEVISLDKPDINPANNKATITIKVQQWKTIPSKPNGDSGIRGNITG